MINNYWTPSPESQEITETDEQYIETVLDGKSANIDGDIKIWGYRDFGLRISIFLKIRIPDPYLKDEYFDDYIWKERLTMDIPPSNETDSLRDFLYKASMQKPSKYELLGDYRWNIIARSDEYFDYPGEDPDRYIVELAVNISKDLEDDGENELKEWLLRRMMQRVKAKIDYFWDHKEEVLKEYFKDEEEM